MNTNSPEHQFALTPNHLNTNSPEHQYTFFIRCRSILLILINISDKHCKENQNPHFVFSDFSRTSCCLWDNVAKHGTAGQATDDNITPRMRFVCWVTNATDQCFSTAGPWHQLYRAARGSPGFCHFSFL